MRKYHHAGDLWGCLGRWYSGGWYDQGAVNSIAQVKAAYDQKTWLAAGLWPEQATLGEVR